MSASPRVTDAEIEQARAVDLAEITRLRGGLKLKSEGQELVGPCPVCGGRDRFAIHLGKKLFHCRGCGAKGHGAISFAMLCDRCDFQTAVKRLIGCRHEKISHREKSFTPEREHDWGDRSSSWALDIWKQSVAPEGTPVAAYLARRHLSAPSSDVIRYHLRCPFGRDENGRTIFTPAMVALVRNIETNAPQAVHRTAVDPQGNKIAVGGKDRMALGPTSGGAVKLTDDAEVTKAIGIAEGIESALSLQLLPEWFGSPIWALLSAGGMTGFPVLPGIETMMVAVDHDTSDQRGQRAGHSAATAVTARWRGAGREVLLAFPTIETADLNDVICEGAS